MAKRIPPAPIRQEPTTWAHYELWKRVCEAVRSLPDHFKSNRTITLATGVGPYPKKGDKITDRPAHDIGKNFGRLARYGIMSAYVTEMKDTPLRGIPVKAWLEFFQRFAKEAPATPD